MKGDLPFTLHDLRAKLTNIWKPLGRWGIVSLGNGFYEFKFSSIEDLRSVRAVSSWSLKPGFLKLFAWSPNYNPNYYKPTTTQCWVRFLSLPQEYWRPKILFAIANSLGTPVSLDAFTSKSFFYRSFGHFARVLIDIDLSTKIRNRIWVEREGYAFLVNVEYENLPLFCTHFQCIGHSFSSKYIPIQKEVLATRNKNQIDQAEVIIDDSIDQFAVHGINNVATHKCVDNNPLLGFVDSNTLRTIVDGEVISIDKVQPEDRCPPIIDNMEGAVTHEEIATPEHIHETLANHEDHGNRNHKDHGTQKQQANTGSQQPIHENESLLVPKMQLEETSIAQPTPNHEVNHGSGVEGNLHQVDLDSYTVSVTQLRHVVIDDMKKIKQAWAPTGKVKDVRKVRLSHLTSPRKLKYN
ncbi:uncharacterized protein LOC123922495 [Trifolium pratense]|uniref:uncharacterized protein LOC123922495 n=1 Tax=Trifolium pratense TaxID=57577 RepID=UPI001E691C54|nr:uncharacterized protein LOC123922495 [Trifolium pratense]